MNRSPGLAEVIRTALRAHALGLRVSLPARVESYDASRQCVDAKPLLKSREATGVVNALPVIRRVPVQFPGSRTKGFRLIYPLAAGDVVELVFADQALDRWKALGGEQDPTVIRTHDLSDAVAIPSINSFDAAWEDAPGDSMKIGKDGSNAQAEFKDSEIILAEGTKGVARVDDSTASGTLSLTSAPGPGGVTVAALTWTSEAGAPTVLGTITLTPAGGTAAPGTPARIEGRITNGAERVKA